MLVSISKLADAGHPSFFRQHCQIFDVKKKVVGEVPWRNGLY
jgi:hypothetical protein